MRFGGQRPAARRLAGVVELAGQQREHLRPPRSAIRQCSRGRLKRLHPLRVHSTEVAHPSPAVGQHRAAEAFCVAELLGEACGAQQRLAMLRVPDLALGLTEADQELAAL